MVAGANAGIGVGAALPFNGVAIDPGAALNCNGCRVREGKLLPAAAPVGCSVDDAPTAGGAVAGAIDVAGRIGSTGRASEDTAGAMAGRIGSTAPIGLTGAAERSASTEIHHQLFAGVDVPPA